MEVFVILVVAVRDVLDCGASVDARRIDASATGMFGRLRHRCAVMVHQAEERQRSGTPPTPDATWWARLQEFIMAWVAERIAEQRLLWNLRRESAVVAAYPED